MHALRTRALLAALTGLVLLLVAASASAGAAETVKPVNVILRPSQIGPGYQLKTRTDSNCVKGCVTLDLCGYAFKTEPLRTARAQVNYFHAEPAVPISNEVVIYRKGGAKKALAEVRKAAATCPKKAVTSSVQGIPPLRYTLTRFGDSQLVSTSLALRIHVTGTSQGKPVAFTDFYIYQVRGNVLSVVYAYPDAGISLAKQQRVARLAAAASAANLRRAVS